MWPGIAFGVSQLLPAFRRRPTLIAVCLAVGGIVFWSATAIAVIDAA